MSRAVVFTEDLNPHKLLTAVSRENIPIFRVDRVANRTQFEIPAKHLSKLLEISARLCYTVSVECYSGAAGLIRRLAVRWAAVLGLVLAVWIVVSVLSRLRAVRIVGAEAYGSEVRAAVAAAGATVGARKRAIDRDAVRAAAEALPYVASATVTLDGVDLTVTVRLAAEEQETEPRPVGNNVVSRFDGIVTGIAVIAGTPRVGVGDLVRRGDVLIEGVDPLDQELAVTARGIVYADVWFCASEDFFPSCETALPSGKRFVVRELLWRDRVWYPSGRRVPYERYDVDVTETPLAKGVLPLFVRTTVYRELVVRTVERDFDAERPAIEARVLAAARERAREGVVTDTFVTVTEKSDRIRVTGVVGTRAVISVAA